MLREIRKDQSLGDEGAQRCRIEKSIDAARSKQSSTTELPEEVPTDREQTGKIGPVDPDGGEGPPGRAQGLDAFPKVIRVGGQSSAVDGSCRDSGQDLERTAFG